MITTSLSAESPTRRPANAPLRRLASRGRTCLLALAAAVSIALPPAAVAQQRPPIIRDAEIEALLRDYAAPIFKAAGIGSRGAQIVIVRDRDFNAFVASGNRMFIHTGALMNAKTPNEVIGVLAHETGHLAGGHLPNLRNEIARAQAIGAVASILSAGAMVAGAAAGSSDAARAGAAGTTVGPGMALRSLLSYRRVQELAADRAALAYLDATGQSAAGMIEVFRGFADQQLFSQKFVDPYALSHPMARERLAQLETVAAKSRHWAAKDSAELQFRHDMMRAKLAGFLDAPAAVDRRYPRSDKSLPAAYARAIAAYRSGGSRGALKAIDALIRQAPNYPYFHELKGQALLESGKAREAVAPLRQAAALAPDAGLIRIMLGQALLATGDQGLVDDAVAQLRTGLQAEPLGAVGYRHLAMALQKQGKVADAELATAQGMLIDGDVKGAKGFAKRAQAKLKTGSPGWLQADDILNYKLPDQKG